MHFYKFPFYQHIHVEIQIIIDELEKNGILKYLKLWIHFITYFKYCRH